MLECIIVVFFNQSQYFLSSHQSGNSLQVVLLAIVIKRFLISIKSEHGDTQRPNIPRRIHILGPKHLFGRIETDGSLLHLRIEAGVVKHRKIPIDKLNLVKLEIEPNRVHHYIAHLYVVVNDTRPVHLVHLLEHLIEKERRLLTV